MAAITFFSSLSSVVVSRRSSFSRTVNLAVVAAFLLLSCFAGIGFGSTGVRVPSNIGFRKNDLSHRKLLVPDDSSCTQFFADAVNESLSLGVDKAGVGNKGIKPDRAWGEDRCSEADIVIDQGPSTPLPSGIPTYSVSILNACSTGCNIGGIHLRCGKFSTARLIDPEIFRRLDYDDCLVYGGRPIPNGETLSFEYANTYLYPMEVIKYECCTA